MQKIIALLLMLLVCTVYVISIKQDEGIKKEDTTIVEESNSFDKRLEELQQILQNNYPGTPKEVMYIYNELIEYQYSDKMTETYVEDSVIAMRMIYSQDLIALNHYEGQVEKLLDEVLINKENKVYITNSSIESIEFTQENMAAVNVKYDTTLKTIDRTYYMIRENNHWKIHSWDDLIY